MRVRVVAPEIPEHSDRCAQSASIAFASTSRTMTATSACAPCATLSSVPTPCAAVSSEEHTVKPIKLVTHGRFDPVLQSLLEKLVLPHLEVCRRSSAPSASARVLQGGEGTQADNAANISPERAARERKQRAACTRLFSECCFYLCPQWCMRCTCVTRRAQHRHLLNRKSSPPRSGGAWN